MLAPAAMSAASYDVSEAIVSPSSQVGSRRPRTTSTCSELWQRSTCSLVAGSASLHSVIESSNTSSRRGVSGW